MAGLALSSTDLVNEGADVYKNVVLNANELSQDTTLSEKERNKLRDNAYQGVVHGNNYGVLDPSIVGDDDISKIYQRGLADGVGMAVAGIGLIKKLPNGKYNVKLKNGEMVEMTKAELVKMEKNNQLEIGKVETYKESKKTRGDGAVDREHNPPKQALIERAEEIKGKPLTERGERRIIENSDTITLTKEVHQQASSSRGYRGDKPKQDAKDLQGTTKKYSDEHIENSKNTEHAECIGVGCEQMNQKTNQEYDDFLRNQFDENN